MKSEIIQKVVVLGSGTAGLLSAISIKRKIPKLDVEVVRSSSLGVIGVGESTTPNFPQHLFEYLGIPRKRFYEMVEPTWKLGIKFLWGPRGRFYYTFNQQLDGQYSDLSKPTGFYCDNEFDDASLPGALMRQDLAFLRQANGAPDVHHWHAFHIENKKFLRVLELVAREHGIVVTDGEVSGAEKNENGIAAINLADGQRIAADFFIDASGFRSELLGKVLDEPFESFSSSLFCDRAVVGGWQRTDEKIKPYTTAETMDSGWAWEIDHETLINRGYVYCSSAISDELAAKEFCDKNPKINSPKIVRFKSGCYRRQWVGNVVAMGNSGGFVEPLESTAIMMLCSNLQTLIDFLLHSSLSPTPGYRNLFNEATYNVWQDIRGFLAIHYKFNTLLDTPFWRQVRSETDVSPVQPLLDFYQENGPTGFCRYRMPQSRSDFGLEGYLVMLVGQQVPYNARYDVPESERELWTAKKATFVELAKKGISPEEALSYVKNPAWRWHSDQ